MSEQFGKGRVIGGEVWYPYATAPKDGRVVMLTAEDAGMYPMYWDAKKMNPLVGPELGLWVMQGGGATWCDRDPDGAPEYWRPLKEGER